MEITSLQKSVESAENQLGTNDEAIQGLAEEAEKLKEKLRFGQYWEVKRTSLIENSRPFDLGGG